MRRRTFLSAAPLAAAGALASAQTATPPLAAGEPKVWAAGANRFNRPDVHAGDRVAGASFSSRSAAMGCSASVAVMLMTWPEPACSIRATACRVRWKNPARFTAATAAKSASV